MSRRDIVRSEVKGWQFRSRSESEFEQSAKLHAMNPKPDDLAMGRLKWG